MKSKFFLIALALAAASLVLAGAQAADSPTMTAAQIVQFTALDSAMAPMTASTTPPFNGVAPHNYDPRDTDSVQTKWLDGTGCPNAVATNNTNNSNGNYTSPTCSVQFDPRDEENDGLLLEKAQTSENSAAFAELKGVKGTTATELGYDLRKFSDRTTPNGSHCGAGAPRFDVYTTDGLFFVGCQSPPPDNQTPGPDWIRLRWGGSVPLLGFKSGGAGVPEPVTGTVQHIFIVFDEGTDTGPDFFGAAFIDNVDYNGQLVGKG